MPKQRLEKRVEKLEAIEPPDRLVIVPSWGDYVYIDGEPILKTEYQGKPEKTINIALTWGDEREKAAKTPNNAGKTEL